MALKTFLRVFGMKFEVDTLVKFAFVEIIILASLFFALIIWRYWIGGLSHELFLELMIIIGVGMSFDHYAMTTLSLKK